MPQGSQLPTSPRPDERPGPSPQPAAGHEPRHAFRAALGRYKGTRLGAIRLAQGASPDGLRIRPSGSADEITEHLDAPASVQGLVARLPVGSRLALGLYGLTEATSFSVAGLSLALRVVETEPLPAIVKLLDLGLLAVDPDSASGPVDEFSEVLELVDPTRVSLRIHPAVPKAIRMTRPEGELLKAAGPISQIRESDGLEGVLRVAAVWQRVGAEPLRQTQQGVLYKRDSDRIDLDPVLASPIADTLAAVPDLPSLWLALACRVGLIEQDAEGERLLAAPWEFWTENEFHLPQMIATAWLALKDWHELQGEGRTEIESEAAVPYLRPALLLWLSTLDESEWVSLEDLADHLSAQWPAWVRLSLKAETEETSRPGPGGGRGRARARNDSGPRPKALSILEAILLGTAYPLGLVRAGIEPTTQRRVVQLSALGRYVLAAGASPPPRPAFEHFLFVQPNFEVIAYRQGLTPQLVGRLSRFAWWSQIGSALELKLSRESIVFGLDRGAKPNWMLETLTRHSQRPLARGVVDAINDWAQRRERVIFYAATTLMEFGNETDRNRALELWPEGEDEAPPVPVAERFLLVENDRAVPYSRLRLMSSRDYRRPPEICVAVERDGVTLTLDPARADLLVDAELSHFADPLPSSDTVHGHASARGERRFLISSASLERGISRGKSPERLSEWFERRTGGEIPASVQLLLGARTSRCARLKAARMVVLTLPGPELVEGLRQHPATTAFLGERLGPSSVAVPEQHLAALQDALKELGIALDVE